MNEQTRQDMYDEAEVILKQYGIPNSAIGVKRGIISINLAKEQRPSVESTPEEDREYQEMIGRIRGMADKYHQHIDFIEGEGESISILLSTSRLDLVRMARAGA